jgi:uncharacterized SAM-binding protein YcdF (DUF218 family)
MTNSSHGARRRRRLVRFAIMVAVLAILYGTRDWTLPAWARGLDASEAPRTADYALVLTGGENTRPFVAAGLFKKGYVGAVLVPQLRLTADARDGIVPSDSELIRRVLEERGVPADKVIPLAGEVNSTFDEATALAHFLDDHPEATVAIVTNDFHTRRARSIFRRVLGARGGQIYMVAAPTDRVTPNNWWKTERGSAIYLSETFKTLYYAVAY